VDCSGCSFLDKLLDIDNCGERKMKRKIRSKEICPLLNRKVEAFFMLNVIESDMRGSIERKTILI
jgi:hypothetical protein